MLLPRASRSAREDFLVVVGGVILWAKLVPVATLVGSIVPNTHPCFRDSLWRVAPQLDLAAQLHPLRVRGNLELLPQIWKSERGREAFDKIGCQIPKEMKKRTRSKKKKKNCFDIGRKS